MPGLFPDFPSFLLISSSARRSLGGLKGLSSSSTEALVAGAPAAGVAAPELEVARGVTLLLLLPTILPPLLPVVGVQDRLAK